MSKDKPYSARTRAILGRQQRQAQKSLSKRRKGKNEDQLNKYYPPWIKSPLPLLLLFLSILVVVVVARLARSPCQRAQLAAPVVHTYTVCFLLSKFFFLRKLVGCSSSSSICYST